MCDGVGIRYLESSFLQVVAVVEQGTADKERAFGINYDANAIGFHHDIAVQPPPMTATRSAP
jgi:hypothetical protein